MRRREFIELLGWVVIARPVAARAQQSTMRRIGFLSNSSGVSALNPLIAGVFTELRRLEWVDGRNAVYEPRFSAGDPERLPSLASDLVNRNVDIIVAAGGTVTARAAQRVTTTIPMEMVPSARRVAVLAQSKSDASLARIAAEARERNMDLVVFEAQSLERLADVLAAVSTAYLLFSLNNSLFYNVKYFVIIFSSFRAIYFSRDLANVTF